MTRLLTILLLIASLAATASAITVDDVPNVHVADRTRYVSDPAGILSAADRARIDRKIAAITDSTTAEIAVAVVDAIDPSMSPEEFATALFEKWGIGKRDKDNGLLILVSRDDRAVQIRTGYGLEGVLPDIKLGRLIRTRMFPKFRNGDYAGGISAAVDYISKEISDPTAAAEIRSDQKTDASHAGDILSDIYLKFAAVAAGGMLVIILGVFLYGRRRRLSDIALWGKLQKLWLPTLVVACLSLGMGVIGALVLGLLSQRIRRHTRECPRCHTRMRLIDEEHDNDYLTPSQDLEEKLKSVDYDVWECPHCRLTDILPYPSYTSQYRECPHCHTRAMSLSDRRVLRPATVASTGEAVDISLCRACGHRDEKRIVLPRVQVNVVHNRRGGGGGFSGGGFRGGSFGGGRTGGGGAGGRW